MIKEEFERRMTKEHGAITFEYGRRYPCSDVKVSFCDGSSHAVTFEGGVDFAGAYAIMSDVLNQEERPVQ